MIKIVLASNNNHKVKEFERILENTNIELIPQRKLGIPEIPETGLTFLIIIDYWPNHYNFLLHILQNIFLVFLKAHQLLCQSHQL